MKLSTIKCLVWTNKHNILLSLKELLLLSSPQKWKKFSTEMVNEINYVLVTQQTSEHPAHPCVCFPNVSLVWNKACDNTSNIIFWSFEANRKSGQPFSFRHKILCVISRLLSKLWKGQQTVDDRRCFEYRRNLDHRQFH